MDKIWNAIKGIFRNGEGKGIIGSLNDIVNTYITTKEERHEMKMAMKQAVHQKELEVQELALRAKAEFNQRIKDMEGTASDLRQAGFFGRVILFLRGAQRPIWGFGTIYADFMAFSGRWNIPEDTQMANILWLINFLVLGFLFSERAVKNVLPIFKNVINKNQNNETK
jgi:hypothetical protein